MCANLPAPKACFVRTGTSGAGCCLSGQLIGEATRGDTELTRLSHSGHCARRVEGKANSYNQPPKTIIRPNWIEVRLDAEKRHAGRALRHGLLEKSNSVGILTQAETGESEVN